jgi:cyclopropane fatty-acyl-phospholipid synthase-like methyltransferase
MKRTQDAFGQSLYDYYQGEDVLEITERSDGYLSASPDAIAGYFAEYRTWPAGLKKAISYARGRSLDIGCGPGRVLMHLQKNGVDAMGVDTSPLAVKICKERGLKNVRQMSIMDLSPAMGSFDTIVMFGNNFGLLGGFNQARTLLKRFYKMTSSDGRIIAQTLDPYETDDPDYLWYHRWNREHGRMGGLVRIRSRYKKLIGPWFDYLFASREEVKKLAAGTGWKVRRFISVSGPGYAAVLEKESQGL